MNQISTFYLDLFRNKEPLDFTKWFSNTLIVAIFTCIISSFIIISVSYALSRLRFKYRKKMMNIALVLGMFPGFLSMIAIYYVLKALDLTNSLVSLVLVYSASAGLNYYIAKGFFDTIPRALDEAAILDGASRFKIFINITIPLSKPIMVYTVLTSFLAPWVDFIFASMIAKGNQDMFTVAVGLYKMIDRETIYNYFTRFCAGGVLIGISISALFMYMQKYYVEGISSGSVKS